MRGGPRPLIGGVDDRGAGRILLHGLDTAPGARLRPVSLTDSDDLAVASLEPEAMYFSPSRGLPRLRLI